MRKEAVNTFNDGLNFDLNPLTTPNNVLTDCVNGTFITFNGDELALQNDAGNIRINIPDNNATEHSLLETYNIGDKVYIIEDDVKFYYENISGINKKRPALPAPSVSRRYYQYQRQCNNPTPLKVRLITLIL